MQNPLVGGIPLDGKAAIEVRERRIIIPGAIEPKPGGMDQQACTMHIDVIDVPNGVVWHFPCGTNYARQLARQIIATADRIDGRLDTGG